MPANTYPYVTGDPILRTCRQGKHCVAAPSMCSKHPRTCLTCCSSRLGRDCGLEPTEVQAANALGAQGHSAAATMTWEQRQVEMAQLRHQLGFRPETEAEIAENLRWRTA